MTSLSSPVDKLTGLSQQEADSLLLKYGYNETEEKKTSGWLLFLKKFWNLSAWLLEAVIILSLILHNYSDAAVVTVVLFINSITTFIQDRKATDAMEELKQKLRISVNTLRDSVWKMIPAQEIVPGDIIRLRKGDFVPADLKLMEGNILVNQSSLTGESGDIAKKESDEIYSGSIITQGETTAQVTSTGKKTYYGKTIELLKVALPKSHMDEVIEKVIKWLSVVIGCMLLIALIVSFVRGINILSILPLMVILFMNAIPVALSVMFSVSSAFSAKQLLSKGVLITRINAPNDAATMDILCVDKTGTLTMNNLSLSEVFPAEGFTNEDVLAYGAQASQEANQDAIDLAFVEAGGKLKSFTQKSFIPFTAEKRQTEAVIESGNETYSVYKGSFNVIAKLTGMDNSIYTEWEKQVNAIGSKGYRTIAVAKKDSGSSVRFIGIAALADPPREDSEKIISELHNLGVSVIMVTGDALPIAKEIAGKTGIGTNIIESSELGEGEAMVNKLGKSNGVAEVYPEDKYKIVKALQADGHIVGMTGDGVNDAPALQQAEVGIAVKNAVDVAKNSASVILTQEGLHGIISPIKIGRAMFERITIWILNKFSRTLLKICFIVLALILFGKYVVSTTVMLLLLLVTDFVIISASNDKIPTSPKPNKWDITALAKIGVVQGLMMAIEGLILLAIGWYFFGLSSNQGQLYTFSFILLLFYAIFSFFVVREKKHFWSSKPGIIDTSILALDFIGGLIISFTGFLELKPLPLSLTLLVIGYVTLTSFTLNDYVKYRMFRHYYKAQ